MVVGIIWTCHWGLVIVMPILVGKNEVVLRRTERIITRTRSLFIFLFFISPLKMINCTNKHANESESRWMTCSFQRAERNDLLERKYDFQFIRVYLRYACTKSSGGCVAV